MAALSVRPGRPIVRGHRDPLPTDIVDLAVAAFVEVTSEHDLYPIDLAFDGRDGPGGSCWVAGTPGAQVVVLRFQPPLSALTTIIVESEHCSDRRTQVIELSGWSEATQRPFEAPARAFEYAPYGKTFHRVVWSFTERDVGHLRVRVVPGHPHNYATLTSIVVRSTP